MPIIYSKLPQDFTFSRNPILVQYERINDTAIASVSVEIKVDGKRLLPPDTAIVGEQGEATFHLQEIVHAYLTKKFAKNQLPTDPAKQPNGLYYDQAIIGQEFEVNNGIKFYAIIGGFDQEAFGFDYVSQKSLLISDMIIRLGDTYNHFIQKIISLNNQPLVKQTTTTQYEFCYVFATEERELSITFEVTFQDNTHQTLTFQETILAKHTLRLNTSYKVVEEMNLDQPASQIREWLVSIQGDGSVEVPSQKYQLITEDIFRQKRIFVYLNSFNEFESVLCVGDLKITQNIQNTIATNQNEGGQEAFILDQNIQNPTHELATGYKSKQELINLEEFLGSPLVYQYFAEFGVYRKVIIERGKYELYNESGDIRGHKFKYRFAKERNVIYTNPARVVPQLEPIPELTLTAFVNSSSQITLNWNAPYAQADYEVFRGTDPNNLNKIHQTTTNSHINPGLDGDTTYYYQIQINNVVAPLRPNASNILEVKTPANSTRITNIIMNPDQFVWQDYPYSSGRKYLQYFHWDPDLSPLADLDAASNTVYLTAGSVTWGKARGNVPGLVDAQYSRYNPVTGKQELKVITPESGSSFELSFYTEDFFWGEQSPAITLTINVPL